MATITPTSTLIAAARLAGRLHGPRDHRAELGAELLGNPTGVPTWDVDVATGDIVKWADGVSTVVQVGDLDARAKRELVRDLIAAYDDGCEGR